MVRMAPTALADLVFNPLNTKSLPPRDEPQVHNRNDMSPMQAIAHGDVPLQGMQDSNANP